jgi:hypothetical protein
LFQRLQGRLGLYTSFAFINHKTMDIKDIDYELPASMLAITRTQTLRYAKVKNVNHKRELIRKLCALELEQKHMLNKLKIDQRLILRNHSKVVDIVSERKHQARISSPGTSRLLISRERAESALGVTAGDTNNFESRNGSAKYTTQETSEKPAHRVSSASAPGHTLDPEPSPSRVEGLEKAGVGHAEKDVRLRSDTFPGVKKYRTKDVLVTKRRHTTISPLPAASKPSSPKTPDYNSNSERLRHTLRCVRTHHLYCTSGRRVRFEQKTDPISRQTVVKAWV